MTTASKPRPILLLAGLLFLTGCGAGWHRTEPTPGQEIGPRSQHLVFGGDSTERWHALRVSNDSVSGIPWLQPIDCDSCRRGLPLTTVDSIQVGHPTRGLWTGFLLVTLGPAVAWTVICSIANGGHSCWPSD